MNSQNKIITDLAIYLQENLSWIHAFLMLVRIFIDNWKSRGKEMHDWNLLPNLSDFYFFYSIICLDSTDIISLETEKKNKSTRVCDHEICCPIYYVLSIFFFFFAQ